MEISSVTVLGGDLRQCYTAEYLHSLGWEVMCYHTPNFPYSSGITQVDCLAQAFEDSDLILTPTPLTRDNTTLFQAEIYPPCPLGDIWEMLNPAHNFAAFSLSTTHQKLLETIGCSVLTFSRIPFFQNQNALLTAEGLLSEVIRCTPFALSSANLLLLGYGCCGTAIGKLFLPLCNNIFLLEQDEEKQKDAQKKGISPLDKKDFSCVLPKCRLIINTIPAPVLELTELSQMHSSCHIFDIASAPFGFPADTTKKCLLPYFRIPGIPGRFSPVTAGEIIGRTIERMTKHAL